MTKIRRARYALLYLEDEYLLDFGALLRGERPPTSMAAGIVAFAILTGERHRLGHQELDVLLSVPAEEWIARGHRDREIIESLIAKGLLLSDAENGRLATLRERDDALSRNAWNLYGALYHYMTQWSGIDTSEGEHDDAKLAERNREVGRVLRDEYGDPPEALVDTGSLRTVELPGAERDGPLYDSLTGRRTTRAFDPTRSMTLEQLDTVMRYVFGCHGYARTGAGVLGIKRTSPSGGGLHPTQVYPIITSVDGIASGIYRYSVGDHALGLLRELDPDDARTAACAFMCGQHYFGRAHVSFVLTARFYRTYWKYRRHHKAYAAILMDVAHLTQTLYLVSGDLGLGAFVSLATNARDIEAELGLDGVNEGVIAMAGCGVRVPGSSPLEPEYSPQPPA